MPIRICGESSDPKQPIVNVAHGRPQLAGSGDKPFLEMYFRFVAQSSRSKSIILVVTKVSSRPIAVLQVTAKLRYSLNLLAFVG
jgi:hypothetical protein